MTCFSACLEHTFLWDMYFTNNGSTFRCGTELGTANTDKQHISGIAVANLSVHLLIWMTDRHECTNLLKASTHATSHLTNWRAYILCRTWRRIRNIAKTAKDSIKHCQKAGNAGSCTSGVLPSSNEASHVQGRQALLNKHWFCFENFLALKEKHNSVSLDLTKNSLNKTWWAAHIDIRAWPGEQTPPLFTASSPRVDVRCRHD